MEDIFLNNELCDGGHCPDKANCARFICNVDMSKANPYVVFNQRRWPGRCPHYLSQPDKRYPSIETL